MKKDSIFNNRSINIFGDTNIVDKNNEVIIYNFDSNLYFIFVFKPNRGRRKINNRRKKSNHQMAIYLLRNLITAEHYILMQMAP